MPTEARRRTGGFTLVEMMAALLVSGLVLLGAHAMLSQIGGAGADVSRAAAEADRTANAERNLRRLLENAELRADSGRVFRGDGRAARFSTWCDVPRGWMERCTATLGVLAVDGGKVLAVQTANGDPLPVRRDFTSATLIYLDNPGDGGSWVPVWTSRLAAPWAVGVVLDRDTLILRVGDRG